MHYLSFVRTGRSSFGVLRGDGVVDLGARFPDIADLKAAIAADKLAEMASVAASLSADVALSDLILLPVIPNPGKILCIGLNYETHRIETKRAEAQFPAVFTRFADSQTGHRQPIILPRNAEKLDFEGELAVIIGRGGRHIAEEDAMAHVAGYAPYNDGSVRDWQRHTHQFTPGKNFPSTGAFGPTMASSGSVADYRTLRLTTRLNGEVVQDASLADLIFPIPRLIAYCSGFTPLSPGDVIITGTPGGVGDRREPPLYMKQGDVVEVDIPGVGRLVNPIVAESGF